MQTIYRSVAAVFLLFWGSLAFAGQNVGLTRVVIDPGHGGKDPGAISKDGKSYEKAFVLDIASRLADKISASYPDVEVTMTRRSDVFIPLGGRADIANSKGADLFISVHINSSTGTAAHGYSVHVLGQSRNKNSDLYRANLDVVRRENSVITLDEDYNAETAPFNPSDSESYIFMTMVQSAYLEQSIAFAQTVADSLGSGPIKFNRGVSQDPFYVLWKTSMPAVLVELGFISNPSDLSHLRSEKDLDAIANRLLAAFGAYKKTYDESMRISAAVHSSSAASDDDVVYGIQIATLSKKLKEGDSRLLGYTARYIPTADGQHYRCIVAISSSKDDALSAFSKCRARYPDCFAVKIEGEKVSRMKLE